VRQAMAWSGVVGRTKCRKKYCRHAFLYSTIHSFLATGRFGRLQ
jgi:hypothetical protein